MATHKLVRNWYDLLEVSPRARPSVIKAAYNTLMQEYHPDKKNGNERIAKELNEAKSVLLDEKKRDAYDVDRNDLSGKIVGNYRVLELIAEGGFGKTYKGEQLHIGTPVCLKHGHYVSPQDEAVLIDEAKAIWDLRHYGIPAMRDVMKLEDGSLALVMSYVPGPTLEQIIKKVKRLEPEHVAWITERSLNVLKYLHFHGVVHGDVKPQNIIVQPATHSVTLVDYGLSVIKPTKEDSNRGYTPFFSPPEQKNGGTLLPESDFYGLGMTMIYALGGDVGTRRVPEDVPDELCRFIKRLIVREVLSRPNWNKEDLVDTFREMRRETFGRTHSDMLAIEGVDA